MILGTFPHRKETETVQELAQLRFEPLCEMKRRVSVMQLKSTNRFMTRGLTRVIPRPKVTV
jgi:hypothetical protein